MNPRRPAQPARECKGNPSLARPTSEASFKALPETFATLVVENEPSALVRTLDVKLKSHGITPVPAVLNPHSAPYNNAGSVTRDDRGEKSSF